MACTHLLASRSCSKPCADACRNSGMRPGCKAWLQALSRQTPDRLTTANHSLPSTPNHHECHRSSQLCNILTHAPRFHLGFFIKVELGCHQPALSSRGLPPLWRVGEGLRGSGESGIDARRPAKLRGGSARSWVGELGDGD